MKYATVDSETDPFRKGRIVRPFVFGFYDGTFYQQFWGNDCCNQLLAFLECYEQPLQLFAHNGGKFDWMFLVEHITGHPKMIGSRLVRATLGKHTLRDSYANMPVALKSIKPKSGVKKGEINYAIMERECRDIPKNKRMISEYLKDDCVTLFDAITDWYDMFGTKPETMASASMLKLRETMKESGISFAKMNERQDTEYRGYYYGGRVECFKTGVMHGDFKIYDVNSMYPFAMATYKHPISNTVLITKDITETTDFVEVDAFSRGALPLRSDTGGISFPHARRVYKATGHEIRAAIALGLVDIYKVTRAVEFTERCDFASFVDHFYSLRLKAKALGDEMNTLFLKLVLNSAYGKFALNPDKFTEMSILPRSIRPAEMCIDDPELLAMPDGDEKDQARHRAWTIHCITDKNVFWSRGTRTVGRFVNVATAASITGAARAVLMDGIAKADKPIYCDTDSIICTSLNVRFDETELGAWKLEGIGDKAAIAGKKLYAVWNGLDGIKKASKGCRMEYDDILHVAKGNEFLYESAAPVMRLNGTQSPLVRRIRSTGIATI